MGCVLAGININWIEVITMVATVATAFVAYNALNTWRHEKKYDIKIRIFAMSRRAMDLVRFIRNPISFDGEINEEILKKSGIPEHRKPTPREIQLLVFHSRLKQHEKTWNEILELRERIWAEFPNEHIFLRFYDLVIKIVIDVGDAHYRLQMLYNLELANNEQYVEEKKALFSLVSSSGNDTLNAQLQQLYQELADEREKFSKNDD